MIDAKGGIAVVQSSTVQLLNLPVAGLMSHANGYMVTKQYATPVSAIGDQRLIQTSLLAFELLKPSLSNFPLIQ